MHSKHFDKKWIDLRKKLDGKKLTIPQLRSMEDRVLLAMTEKESPILKEFLCSIEERRMGLLQKEILKQNPQNLCKILKIKMLFEEADQSQWEERVKEANDLCQTPQKGLRRLEFSMQEPLAFEFDPEAVVSTFASRMGSIAKIVRQQNSIELYQVHLNERQKREVGELAGSTSSPEILAHAVEKYVELLRSQIQVAEAFYFGDIQKAKERFFQLPTKIQERIEALMEEASKGELKPSSCSVIAAILHSVEEQMGIHDQAA